MKYKNLLKNECPKCGDNLEFMEKYNYYQCPCGYVIEESDYDYIKSLEKSKLKEYHINTTDENLSRLNNL